jgi:anti-anti-sigma factor
MVGLLRVVTIREGYALVEGELDAATAPMIRSIIEDLDVGTSLLDLSGLTFVDSSGLHALLDMRRSHPAVRFVFPSPQLRRLVELTGTESILFDA